MINLLNRLGFLNRSVSDKKKIFLIILVCLLLVYIDSFLLKAQLKNIKTIRPKIIKLKQDLDTLAKDLLILQDLKQRQGQAKQAKALQVKRIIPEEQIPSLLQDISSIANKHKIKIMQINPSKELQMKEEKVSGGLTNFTPRAIILNLSCDYHRLGKFISDLENAQDFLAVEELRIIPDANNYFLQNTKLVLKTYVRR